MKKIMSLMLGMTLLFGTVSMFAGDNTTKTKATKAAKTHKAKKTTKATS